MAFKAGVTTGNFSTAGTWESIVNTPSQHLSTNLTITGTLYTAAFTAPNTTDAATGLALFLYYVGTAGTVTVTLQQNSAGWVDCSPACSAAINIATLYAYTGSTSYNPLNNWVYFRAGTPFTYLSTTASYYRWKVVLTGGAGTTSGAADSAGTALSYLTTSSATGVPAATDEVWIFGNNLTTACAVSVDGSQTIGNGSIGDGVGTVVWVSPRVKATGTNFFAVNIGYGGTLDYDNAASATLTVKGIISVGGGGTYRQDDKAGGAYAAAYIATLTFTPTLTADYGIGLGMRSTCIIQGQRKTGTTLFKANPSATWAVGDGTTGHEVTITGQPVTMTIANPCVVTFGEAMPANQAIVFSTTDALPTGLTAGTAYYVKSPSGLTFNVSTTPGGAAIETTGTQSGSHTIVPNWAVNDEIQIGPTAAYGQTEYKFIKTITNGKTMTLSATAGGAESALTYAHSTDAWVLNLTRNVVINTNNSAKGWWLLNNTIFAGMDIDWARFEYGYNIYTSGNVSVQYPGYIDYCVYYQSTHRAFYSFYCVTPRTYNGLVFAKHSGTGTNMLLFMSQDHAKTFNWCFWIDCYFNAVYGNGYDYTFNYCYLIACNQRNGTTTSISPQGMFSFTFNYCEVHLGQYGAVGFAFGNGKNVFNYCLFGTKGANLTKTDVSFADNGTGIYDGYEYFNNCTFQSLNPPTAPPYFTYPGGVQGGTGWKFTNLNLITTNNFFYQYEGFTRITGYGLNDTKVRKSDGTWDAAASGEYAFMISPSTSQGTMPCEFISYVPSDAVAGVPITISVWCKLNSASYYAGVNTMPTLKVTYDDTTEVSAVATTAAATEANGELLTVTFTPVNSYKDFKVEIYGATDASTLANTYIYFDDFTIKERLYTKQFYSFTKGTIDVENKLVITNAPALSANPYITEATQATVDAYTGITINHATQTLTLSEDHTLKEVYDYSQSDLTLTANAAYDEWFTTLDGVNFTSTYDIVLNTGVDLTGGGTIDVGAGTFTKTGTATYDGIIIYTATREVHLKLNGLVAGSTVQVYDNGAATELYKDVVAGTSLDYIYTYTADSELRIRVRKAGYTPYEYTGDIVSTGLSLNVAQDVDDIYVANSIDGSTVTEFALSEGVVGIFIDDPTDATTGQRMYNWYMYAIATTEFIDDQANLITALTSYDYILDDTLLLKNQDAVNPVFVSGANLDNTTGNGQIIDTTGGNINIKGHSPAPNKVQIGEAVWDATKSGHETAGTFGEKVSKKLWNTTKLL